LGKHIWIASPDAVTVFLKGLFISEVCFTGVIVSVKYSLLCFYWRLFKVHPSVRRAIYVLLAIVTAWGIAIILVVCLQCRPLRGFWDKSTNAVCAVNDFKFFYGNSIPNIATDIAILILPIHSVLRLKITNWQRFCVLGIFVLGGFIIAISVTRLLILLRLNLHSPDVTWEFVHPQIWTCLEINVATICCCLPSLRPIILLFIGVRETSQSKASKGNSTGASGWPTLKTTNVSTDDDADRLFTKLPEQYSVTQVTIGDDLEMPELNFRNINVRSDVDVQIRG